MSDTSNISNVKSVGEYEEEILAAWRNFTALAARAGDFNRCIDFPIRASDNLRISEVSAMVFGSAPSGSASEPEAVADDASLVASPIEVASGEGVLGSSEPFDEADLKTERFRFSKPKKDNP